MNYCRLCWNPVAGAVLTRSQHSKLPRSDRRYAMKIINNENIQNAFHQTSPELLLGTAVDKCWDGEFNISMERVNNRYCPW